MNIDLENSPPEPEKTGVEPIQSTPPNEVYQLKPARLSAGGIGHYPLTEAIREISESGVRGQAGMLLLFASTQRLESDLLVVRQEKDNAVKELNAMKINFFEKKEIVEVLKERLNSVRKLRLTQNVMITLGGMIAGTAASLLKANNIGWPIAGIVLGGFLLFAGWYGFHDEKEEVKS